MSYLLEERIESEPIYLWIDNSLDRFNELETNRLVVKSMYIQLLEPLWPKPTKHWWNQIINDYRLLKSEYKEPHGSSSAITDKFTKLFKNQQNNIQLDP